MGILTSMYKFCLNVLVSHRMITKAVMIDEAEDKETINSKTERTYVLNKI